MISPFTKPGTKVALLDDAGKFSRGEIVTIRNMVDFGDGVSAALEEHEGRNCYALIVLRYLELPKSITSCLTTQPLLVDELTGEAATGDSCAPPVVTARGLR